MTLDAKMFWKKSEKTHLSQVWHLKIIATKYRYTPRKINMEPKHHPFRKENHLNQTIILRFQPLIFQGVPTEAARPTIGLDDWTTSMWAMGSATGAFKAPWGPCTNATITQPSKERNIGSHQNYHPYLYIDVFFWQSFLPSMDVFFFAKFFAPTLLYHSVLA